MNITHSLTCLKYRQAFQYVDSKKWAKRRTWPDVQSFAEKGSTLLISLSEDLSQQC